MRVTELNTHPCPNYRRALEALKTGLGEQVGKLAETHSETAKRVGAVEESLTHSVEGLTEAIATVRGHWSTSFARDPELLTAHAP